MDWVVFWSTFIASFVGTGLAGIIAFIVYLIQRADRRKEVKAEKAFVLVTRINEDINQMIREISDYHDLSILFPDGLSTSSYNELKNLDVEISRRQTRLVMNNRMAATIFDLSDMNEHIDTVLNNIRKENELLPLDLNNNQIEDYIKSFMILEEDFMHSSTNDKEYHKQLARIIILYYSSMVDYYIIKYTELINK